LEQWVSGGTSQPPPPTTPNGPNGHSSFPREEGDLLDAAALLDYVDGDRQLLRKIVGRFRENGPRLLSQVREAIARQDGPALEFSAHKLKGAVGSFFAT